MRDTNNKEKTIIYRIRKYLGRVVARIHVFLIYSWRVIFAIWVLVLLSSIDDKLHSIRWYTSDTSTEIEKMNETLESIKYKTSDIKTSVESIDGKTYYR